MDAIIIGGGIGGLAAAIALEQAGATVTVYERAAGLREAGAGLALWANALRALDALDLGAAVRALGAPAAGGALRTWSGQTLVAASTPITVVHRAELQATLFAALADSREAVQLGAECVGFEQDSEGVTARFADGATARGDLLVGADGLHSVIRAGLFGNRKPTYAGYTAWRGVANFEPARISPGESWGYGDRFGMLPMSQGRVYWFATENAPEGAPDGPMGRKRELQSRFSGWHEPIPELIATTPFAAILRNDIYDRPSLRRWSAGRVTLLGDAAHPMTPNLGQGACQALEDAVVLAQALAQENPVTAALRAYEAARLRRTRAIVAQSRRLGQIGQWDRAWACGLRNELLRHLPAAWLAHLMGAIVDYRPNKPLG